MVTTGLETICCCRLSPHAVATNCLKLDFCNFGVRADIVTRKAAILQVFLISQNLNPAQDVKLFLSIKLSKLDPYSHLQVLQALSQETILLSWSKEHFC